MICEGCGQRAYATFTRWPKNEKGETEKVQTCNICGGSSIGGSPDIYWDGKPEEGLADDAHTGKPRVFGSRGEKARYLKERGLIEAGDRQRGAPASILSNRVENRGLSAQQALQRVRQMGADVRRQEFLRIIKEGHRG